MVENPLASKIAVFREEIAAYGRANENSYTPNELKAALSALGQGTSDAEIEETMKTLSLSENNEAGSEEAPGVTGKAIKIQVALEELINTFRVFDKDRNGQILTSELKLVMNSLGERLTRPEIEEIIKEGNPNMEEYMNYEQFVRRVLAN